MLYYGAHKKVYRAFVCPVFVASDTIDVMSDDYLVPLSTIRFLSLLVKCSLDEENVFVWLIKGSSVGNHSLAALVPPSQFAFLLSWIISYVVIHLTLYLVSSRTNITEVSKPFL